MNTGALGEEAALQWYLAEGYTLLARNYHARQGEIDLIVQNAETLVFVEVKTRGQNRLGTPAEWVDARKQEKIRGAALHYLERHHLGDPPLRFDVVEVLVDKAGSLTINCIPNAF
ncbi:YraN family protein [Ruminococcaceae bacterium OttesenSCG-928-I18]|nr:YraN family protein [Ruminococcaceae bacterium OttesenSCG-928-I18]